MQREYYLQWLNDWFSQKIKLPDDAMHRNFFTEGWLDSLSTLELIVAIENELHIPLNDSTLNDVRFSSINCLAEMLCELKNVNRISVDD